jgi:hypothetical protein
MNVILDETENKAWMKVKKLEAQAEKVTSKEEKVLSGNPPNMHRLK